MTAQPQHLEALEFANRIRLARAQMKRDIHDGELAAVDVLRDPPEHAVSMRVYDLLCSQHRWGRARARRVLLAAGVSEARRVGQLTDRQREAVAAMLDAKAGRVREMPEVRGG